MGSTNLGSVLEEIILLSGNAFLGDLETIGLTTDQFIATTRMSLRKWLEYRSIKPTISIVHDGSQVIDLRTYFDQVPKIVSSVKVDCQTIGYRYNQCGIIHLQGASGNCVEIGYVMVDPSNLLRLIQNPTLNPQGTADTSKISNWELGFTAADNRLDEFIQLVLGNFMLVVGRACRRFRIEEMPIGLDADSLISEGQSIVDAMTTQMQETSDSFDNVLSGTEYTATSRGYMNASFRIP